MHSRDAAALSFDIPSNILNY